MPPPTISVELKALDLSEPLNSVQTTPTLEIVTPFSFSDISSPPEIKTYTPTLTFNVTTWEDDEDRKYTFSVAKDVYFVTAHPCVLSNHVRIFKSPSSPTIQQIDLSGLPGPGNARPSNPVKIMCKHSTDPVSSQSHPTFRPVYVTNMISRPPAAQVLRIHVDPPLRPP